MDRLAYAVVMGVLGLTFGLAFVIFVGVVLVIGLSVVVVVWLADLIWRACRHVVVRYTT